jgi:hypothetical protein
VAETLGAKATKAGFKVGAIVILGKKVDVEVQHGRLREKIKTHVKKGQEGRIVSLTEKGAKVKFTVVAKETEKEIEVDLPLTDIECKSVPEGPTDDPAELGPAMPPGFEFARLPCTEVSVVQWPLSKKDADISQQLHNVKSTTSFLMAMIAGQAPEYGPDDFAVVLRDRQTEVWSMRAFKAGELLLAPETTELKDCLTSCVPS